MKRSYEGGCLCGSVRYAVTGPAFDETNCHCSLCRRSSGAPFLAWFSVRRDDLTISGRLTHYRSSSHGVRGFCPTCGTQIIFSSTEAPAVLDVTSASLDEPKLFPPKSHSYFADKLDWVIVKDGLPRYAAALPG